MTDKSEVTAARWKRWLETPDGKHAADASSLDLHPRLEKYLQNRLWYAFVAGAGESTPTAPAGPPKEVAALIERLRKDAIRMLDTRDDRYTAGLEREAADALARLSAPVPDKEKRMNEPMYGPVTTADRLDRLLDQQGEALSQFMREAATDAIYHLRAQHRKLLESDALPARELSENEVINAVYRADGEPSDVTRVSEMTPAGWKATTIFNGDAGLLRFARLIASPPPAADK